MKRKYRYGYKVTRIVSSKPRSFSNHARQIYGIDKVTRPDPWDGPLTVFNTYEDALAFVRKFTLGDDYTAIYRCKYISSKRKHARWKIWARDHNGSMYGNKACNLPYGTRLAERVTLTYKVGREGERI